MKVLSFATSAVLTVSALCSFAQAHIAISNPLAQAGPWSKNPDMNVHSWLGYKGKKFPCGGYKPGPVNNYKAGDIINVHFWNFNIGAAYKKFPPKSGLKQSRHGGGACEFSLSPDGGKSWHVIGQYTKSCPDINYEWPVQIPHNIPDCLDSNKCLFSMSWIAYSTDQFYHHCANVIIKSDPKAKNKAYPPLKMTVVDVAQLKEQRDTHAVGDTKTSKGNGPDPSEVKKNKSGFFAAGGPAGTKGLNLNLVKRH
ncbi:hypothetical protein B0O80DRAFT_426830 [Mortierella sp. GBAus27b]|nr:hypothetical protein BGX31_007959 [Mortierella sp. GBA43]KAI8353420.1 hypothetical protein B0O80DRAFT_426830 [Mortierella sp. GBAus27b]